MAIQQNNKIIASEINNSAATNFSQGAFIYASDIASLYGGTDNIAKGVLIRAEHFQNLGLPGSGGLNGTFNGVSFKNAIADSNSGLEYVQDSNGWTLYITKGGTINFTNFGRYGNSTDIFMIGGGGAGNKDGLSGSGGFYSTTNSKALSTGSNYSLTIGSGGSSNGASGGNTSGFGLSVSGGYGGKAHISTGRQYATFTVTSHDGGDKIYLYQTAGRIIDEYEGTPVLNYDGSQDRVVTYEEPYTGQFWCQSDGNILAQRYYLYRAGQYVYNIVEEISSSDHRFYRIGSSSRNSDITKEVAPASRPSDEKPSTSIFGTTTTVGGSGSTSSATAGSRYGQGGGALGQYGASSFGVGKSGIIAIRNHR